MQLTQTKDMPHFPASRTDGVKSDGARVRAAIDLHYDGLWRFVRRLGIPEGDVEDVVQRALLVFAQRSAEVKAGSERSFLFSTALRVASEARKQRARSKEQLTATDAELDVVDPSPTPDAELHQRRMRRLLDEALAMLSDEHRAVLVLCDLQEETMADASEILGIAAGTVASRLRRAREEFEIVTKQIQEKVRA